MMEMGDQDLTIALFQDFPIRRTWHNGRWFFSIIDIIAGIVQTKQPTRYWSETKAQLKKDLKEQTLIDELFGKIEKLAMPSANSKMYKTECADMETVLRIIQAIPHPNAEPFTDLSVD
jgi:prophage antirepressor-like protein